MSKYIITAMVIVTLFVLNGGIASIFGLRYYILDACQTTSSGLDSFVVGLIGQNISIPKLTFWVATNFPSEFLLNTTAQTQYGPIYIDSNITIPLPQTIGLPIGPYITTIKDLLVLVNPDSLLSSIHLIRDVCSTSLLSAVYIIGSLLTVLFTWLTVVTFIIGMKIFERFSVSVTAVTPVP